MLARISHNWMLKITALVLSIAVWSHVRGQVNPWENATFKVRLKAEAPRGFVLLGQESLPRTVTVILRGPRLSLRALKGPAPANPLASSEDAPLLSVSQLQARMVYSEPHKGEQTATVKAVSEIEDVEVIGIKPNEIAVSLDAAETRRFNVRPQVSSGGELEVEQVSLSAKSATVSGLSKVLDRVARVRARVAATELKPGVLKLEKVPLAAVDSRGVIVPDVVVEPDFVGLEIRVREKQESKSVRVVVQTSGDVEPGYKIGVAKTVPARLTIRGPRRVLAAIETVPVKVDIDGATRTVNRRVIVELPRGVEAADGRRVRVQVPIRENIVLPQPTSTPAPPPPNPPRDTTSTLPRPAPRPTPPAAPILGTFPMR